MEKENKKEKDFRPVIENITRDNEADGPDKEMTVDDNEKNFCSVIENVTRDNETDVPDKEITVDDKENNFCPVIENVTLDNEKDGPDKEMTRDDKENNFCPVIENVTLDNEKDGPDKEMTVDDNEKQFCSVIENITCDSEKDVPDKEITVDDKEKDFCPVIENITRDNEADVPDQERTDRELVGSSRIDVGSSDNPVTLDDEDSDIDVDTNDEYLEHLEPIIQIESSSCDNGKCSLQELPYFSEDRPNLMRFISNVASHIDVQSESIEESTIDDEVIFLYQSEPGSKHNENGAVPTKKAPMIIPHGKERKGCKRNKNNDSLKPQSKTDFCEKQATNEKQHVVIKLKNNADEKSKYSNDYEESKSDSSADEDDTDKTDHSSSEAKAFSFEDAKSQHKRKCYDSTKNVCSDNEKGKDSNYEHHDYAESDSSADEDDTDKTDYSSSKAKAFPFEDAKSQHKRKCHDSTKDVRSDDEKSNGSNDEHHDYAESKSDSSADEDDTDKTDHSSLEAKAFSFEDAKSQHKRKGHDSTKDVCSDNEIISFRRTKKKRSRMISSDSEDDSDTPSKKDQNKINFMAEMMSRERNTNTRSYTGPDDFSDEVLELISGKFDSDESATTSSPVKKDPKQCEKVHEVKKCENSCEQNESKCYINAKQKDDTEKDKNAAVKNFVQDEAELSGEASEDEECEDDNEAEQNESMNYIDDTEDYDTEKNREEVADIHRKQENKVDADEIQFLQEKLIGADAPAGPSRKKKFHWKCTAPPDVPIIELSDSSEEEEHENKPLVLQRDFLEDDIPVPPAKKIKMEVINTASQEKRTSKKFSLLRKEDEK